MSLSYETEIHVHLGSTFKSAHLKQTYIMKNSLIFPFRHFRRIESLLTLF